MGLGLPRLWNSGIEVLTHLDEGYLPYANTHDLQVIVETRRLKLPPAQLVYPLQYRLRETDYGYVDLCRMIFNWRICLTEYDNMTYSKGWCFLGPQGLTEALKAGHTYEGVGELGGRWYKAVHSQETRGQYRDG